MINNKAKRKQIGKSQGSGPDEKACTLQELADELENNSALLDNLLEDIHDILFNTGLKEGTGIASGIEKSSVPIKDIQQQLTKASKRLTSARQQADMIKVKLR